MMIKARLLSVGLLALSLAPRTAQGQHTVALSRLLAPEYQYFTSRGGVWLRADGKSFVMQRPVEEYRQLVMVVNWIEEPRRRTAGRSQ